MIILEGKFNSAKVFTDNVEATAISQIIELCNQEFTKGSQIRIMPDTHAGAGCTIGTTMTIQDKIVPNLVGVDIGCGMEVIELQESHIELEKLDKVIRQHIPAGFDIRNEPHAYASSVNFDGLLLDRVDLARARRSIGTLGGGNHFIEVNRDDDGGLYLVVHSGSRHLGKQVAEAYQEMGYDQMTGFHEKRKEIIAELKAKGRKKDIQKELAKAKPAHVNKALAYVHGELFNSYIHDMTIVQHFASMNRKAIIYEISKYMGFRPAKSQFTTIHNYIDTTNMILRKGAISARDGELVLIPINMRDGSLLCLGKGNPDWNYSAPHGAGRLMSRSEAKGTFTLTQFKESMEGIFTTSVSRSTIDECPMAYKPMEEIVNNIQDTVEILATIKPIYNFKKSKDGD